MDKILKLENFGRHTNVIFAGIDLSGCLYGVSFSQIGETLERPQATVTIDILSLFERISKLTDTEIKQAGEIIREYLDFLELVKESPTTKKIQ